MQLSKNQKIFASFFSNFQNLPKNWNTLKKIGERQRLFVSKIIDLKKWSYLYAQKAPCQNTYGQSTC